MYDQIKISFVIPCYNVKDYIEECIESIINQHFDEDYEIICVDNGSTDGTIELVESLHEKYNFLQIYVNDINRGIAYSRNRGTSLSRGKYVWYVDSDDIIAPGAISYFYSVMEQNSADIIVGQYIKFSDLSELISKQDYLFDSQRYSFQIGVNMETLPTNGSEKSAFVMPMMLSMQFIVDNQVSFDDKLFWGEDQLYHLKLECVSKKVIRTDYPCYLYRVRPGSESLSRSSDRYKKLYVSMREMYCVYNDILKNKRHPNEEKMHRLTNKMQCNVIYALCGVSDKNYVEKELKNITEDGIFPVVPLEYDEKGLRGIMRKKLTSSKLCFLFNNTIHTLYYKICGLDKKAANISNKGSVK